MIPRSLASLAALSLAAAASAATLNVVTTTADLADIARAVGGDRVRVTALSTGVQDAHFVDAKPSTILKARDADLLVEVGLELETGWLPAVVEGSRNPKLQAGKPGRLDASEGVVRLEVPSGTVDRSQGDVHAFGNPHYWLDPRAARTVAATLATRLAQLDPSGRADFEKGRDAFQRALDEAMFGPALVTALGGEALWQLADAPGWPANLDAIRAQAPATPALGGWAGKLRGARGAHVITYHRSWTYLLARFGIASSGEIEPKPGIPPTPSHVAGLIAACKADRAGAILVEPFYGDQAASLIARACGARVLRLPLSVGGDAAATGYLALLDHIVTDLAGALPATGTP